MTSKFLVRACATSFYGRRIDLRQKEKEAFSHETHACELVVIMSTYHPFCEIAIICIIETLIFVQSEENYANTVTLIHHNSKAHISAKTNKPSSILTNFRGLTRRLLLC